MGQYFCHQCQRWMDSQYAGTQSHLNTHLFGRSGSVPNNSNSSGAEGMGLLAVFIYSMFKKYQANKKTQVKTNFRPTSNSNLDYLTRLSVKRHLLHWVLIVLTAGLFIPLYVFIIFYNVVRNRPLK